MMAIEPTKLRIEEYRALRATIRERGSLRLLVSAITFSVWASTILAVSSLFVVPVFGLVPLLVLAAGFETVFALHVGVERIGRYLQVNYERELEAQIRWEHTAMTLAVPGGGVDPLFVRLFLSAAFVNLLLIVLTAADSGPPAAGAVSLEILLYAAVHLAVAVRWIRGARFATTQRGRELEAFAKAAKP